MRQTVSDIIQDVIKNGDKALLEYNNKFDHCQREALRITAEEIQEAYAQMSREELEDFSPFVGISLGH